MCPENVMLKALMQNLLLLRNEAVVMDMEAGVEHLGRATAQAVNQLIVVVEPGKRSIETAFKIRELAGDIQLTKISIIANKIRNREDETFVLKNCEGFNVIGFLNYDQEILRSDMERLPPWEVSPQSIAAIRKIAERIINGT